ncbi:hypothetical protein R3P38DRAFT_1855057 [Favolaschia claudopus]|uniref:Uncharacterized protein n=1 Tax=Favolaschia claudopus TaxID=2862362 RepID=A0AAW0DAG8_9AGAR
MDHDELPRISIPSMRVWLRIKADYSTELHQKVVQYANQNNLPSWRRDEMIKLANEHVDKWASIAQSNIRINGRDFDSLQPHEQDAEPFDEALDRKIWALAGSRLEWHRKIAQERREKPIALENTLQELVKEHERLDAELDGEEAMLSDMDDEESSLQVNVDDNVMGQIIAVAGELAQNLPTQRERSERSKAVQAEFTALKS